MNRRLYFYTMAFAGLQSTLWGAVLTLHIFASGLVDIDRTRLAIGLALLVVGIPVFLFHGGQALRMAQADPEERLSRTRAVFLYTALLFSLSVAVVSATALFNAFLRALMGAEPASGGIFPDLAWFDVALLTGLYGLTALGLHLLTRSVWNTHIEAEPEDEALTSPEHFLIARRIFRHLLLLLALGILVFGAQQAILWLAGGLGLRVANGRPHPADPMALLLAGVPLFFIVSTQIWRSLGQPGERSSSVRLGMLYLTVFLAGGGALTGAALTIGAALDLVLSNLLGERIGIGDLLQLAIGPLSFALPLAAAWGYAEGQLNLALRMANLTPSAETPTPAARQTAAAPYTDLRRSYQYALALLGLGASVLGLQRLLDAAIFLAMRPIEPGPEVVRARLAEALGLLIFGLPLWWLVWRPLQAEASREGEPGERVRRSAARRSYLFMVLLVSGLMALAAAAIVVVNLLRQFLAGAEGDLTLLAIRQGKNLLLYGGVLAYHWLLLRADQEQAERALARRHALFPVLILAPDEEPEGEPNFADTLVRTLQRMAPEIPVAVHPYSQGVPDPTLATARAIILPAELLARPAEGLRLWLQNYDGARLVLPTASGGWLWVLGSGTPLAVLARQAAAAVRQLAEGGAPSQPQGLSPFQVLVYLLAGLFALELLFLAVGAVFVLLL